MSRDASITLEWADGEYMFKLGAKQLAELQEKTDAGPQWVFNRLESETWRDYDVVEPIRLGLIGGGLPPEKALSLVKSYIRERTLLEHVETAQQIVAASLRGAPDEPTKKDEGRETTSESPISQTEKSVLPPSTEPVP